MELNIWEFFEKIQNLLQSDRLNEYFTWRPIHIHDNISLSTS